MQLRHRTALVAPFVLLLLVTWIGGLVNTTDARTRIIDDLTDKGVKGAQIAHGIRSASTDENGDLYLPNVPRTSKYQIDAPGYFRTSAPTTAEQVRLKALSVTIYAYDATKTEVDRVKSPQARQGTLILATGTPDGQMTVAPHPGRDAKLTICAEGFEPKEITVVGVLMQVGLTPGPTGCPPLPSASPAPGATPSPSAPAPSPSASPTRSP